MDGQNIEPVGHDNNSDLDRLLQQTLEDFDRPVLLPSEKNRPGKAIKSEQKDIIDGSSTLRENVQSDKLSSSQMFDHKPDSSRRPDKEPLSREQEDDDFLKETTKEIDDVLITIAQEDPQLAKQLRELTEYAAGVSSADEDTAVRNLSQFASMFRATLKNVSSQSGVPADDLADDDLNEMMENLEKLAMGGEPFNFGGKDNFSDSNIPLNDVVKALLAKDVMFSSLQRCEEEYLPWLEANRKQLSVGDCGRYESQLTCVKSLIVEYQSQPDNLKDDPEEADKHYQRLIDMIGRLQQLGSFPEDLMAKVNTDVFGAGLSKPTRLESDNPDLNVPDCKTT